MADRRTVATVVRGSRRSTQCTILEWRSTKLVKKV